MESRRQEGSSIHENNSGIPSNSKAASLKQNQLWRMTSPEWRRGDCSAGESVLEKRQLLVVGDIIERMENSQV